jgi:hypothetical protein
LGGRPKNAVADWAFRVMRMKSFLRQRAIAGMAGPPSTAGAALGVLVFRRPDTGIRVSRPR